VSDYLFANQKTFTAANVRENVTNFALANAGVDKTQFQTCLDKRMAVGGVSQDVELGDKNGVHSTPTLFINGVKYEGAKDVVALRAILAGIRKSQQTTDAGTANTKVAAAK
jgi:protein-disulfide isomerase